MATYVPSSVIRDPYKLQDLSQLIAQGFQEQLRQKQQRDDYLNVAQAVSGLSASTNPDDFIRQLLTTVQTPQGLQFGLNYADKRGLFGGLTEREKLDMLHKNALALAQEQGKINEASLKQQHGYRLEESEANARNQAKYRAPQQLSDFQLALNLGWQSPEAQQQYGGDKGKFTREFLKEWRGDPEVKGNLKAQNDIYLKAYLGALELGADSNEAQQKAVQAVQDWQRDMGALDRDGAMTGTKEIPSKVTSSVDIIIDPKTGRRKAWDSQAGKWVDMK